MWYALIRVTTAVAVRWPQSRKTREIFVCTNNMKGMWM